MDWIHVLQASVHEKDHFSARSHRILCSPQPNLPPTIPKLGQPPLLLIKLSVLGPTHTRPLGANPFLKFPPARNALIERGQRYRVADRVILEAQFLDHPRRAEA